MEKFVISVEVNTVGENREITYKLLENTFKGKTEELERIQEKIEKDEEPTDEESDLMTAYVILKQMEGVITTLQEELVKEMSS